jgi:hypothetical protein
MSILLTEVRYYKRGKMLGAHFVADSTLQSNKRILNIKSNIGIIKLLLHAEAVVCA